jgi:sulfur carrier protein
MEIIINSQKKHIPDSTTVENLMEMLEVGKPKGMAIAVNKKIVPRESWEYTTLQDSDEVIMIKAAKGG